MEIYIIRHGKTYWNSQNKIQGWTDIELNEDGRDVAVKSQVGMKDIHFDAIYSSPLKRAYETACILKGDRDIPVIVEERIKELGFGVLEGADFSKIKDASTGDQGTFFSQPEKYVVPEGGESFDHVTERAGEFIAELVKKHGENDRVMIVAHGAVNKAMMRYIRKAPLEEYWAGPLQYNCGVNIICYHDGAFEILEENKVFYEKRKKKVN